MPVPGTSERSGLTLSSHCQFVLPAWVGRSLADWPEYFPSSKARMQLAIALSKESVLQNTGGPFGALVVDEYDGRLVSVGVNLVTTAGLSAAHAEIVALSLAQTAMGHWNLSQSGSLQLVTSCEPCAMCFGALPWSGISSLVCGARKQDAEAAGFDEGDKPDAWVGSLQRRGISVESDVLRVEAAAVLDYYRQTGGPVYNATQNPDEAGD